MKIKSFCPECGLDVGVDEEACCMVCGATAWGTATAVLVEVLEAHPKILKELHTLLRQEFEP